jgi:hypothetical protein
MVGEDTITWMNDGASFEARSLRHQAPQDEEVDVLHERSRGGSHSGRSNPPLILKCSGEARVSKDAPSLFQDEPFAMPPSTERPVFDLPLSASRWRWRGP